MNREFDTPEIEGPIQRGATINDGKIFEKNNILVKAPAHGKGNQVVPMNLKKKITKTSVGKGSRIL